LEALYLELLPYPWSCAAIRWQAIWRGNLADALAEGDQRFSSGTDSSLHDQRCDSPISDQEANRRINHVFRYLGKYRCLKPDPGFGF
jgi:hypothetical protein